MMDPSGSDEGERLGDVLGSEAGDGLVLGDGPEEGDGLGDTVVKRGVLPHLRGK